MTVDINLFKEEEASLQERTPAKVSSIVELNVYLLSNLSISLVLMINAVWSGNKLLHNRVVQDFFPDQLIEKMNSRRRDNKVESFESPRYVSGMIEELIDL
jgi:hypothetical protein